MRSFLPRMGLWLGTILLASCGASPWNNPYPPSEEGKNILYGAFSERPKHLDPARAYSANEYVFIAQIYEPPLQYHYLKRPYTLVPLTAEALPRPIYLDGQGQRLPPDAEDDAIAYSAYTIRIRPGIFYQPHPAFAKDAQGRYLYHRLGKEDLADIHTLADFKATGTRELTASDYVYQIKRLAHPRVHSPIFGIMAQYIVGLKALARRLEAEDKGGFLDLRDYPLEGAKVIDRYTYRITLKGKYPQFLYWLAMPFFSPVPWEVDRFYAQPGMEDKNITLDWYPVGTGPYMLTENDPNLRMVLSRNPNFHGETYPVEGEKGDGGKGLLKDAGKPIPFIDKVVFSLEKEDIPYWNKFLQGYYDSSGITSDSFDQAIRFDAQGRLGLSDPMREKGIRLSTAVATSIFYMGFNMLDPVVGGLDAKHRKLRQAISIALDYEEYIAIFLNGRGVPAQGPIPPGIFGHLAGSEGINPYVYDWQGGKARRKPLAFARRLLAEAGYPGGIDPKTGKPLMLYFDVVATGPDDKARLDWFRKQFRKLNIELVVRNTDYNRFQDKMRQGNAQLFLWGWNADYPDPENFLFLLYGPNGKAKHGGENAANYENPAFDGLFEEMRHMDNTPKRLAIIRTMVDIARRDAPWVWGLHPKQFSLYHAWYFNAKPNLMANNTVKYLRIDPRLRMEKRKAWNEPVLWPLGLFLGALLGLLLPAYVTHLKRERR